MMESLTARGPTAGASGQGLRGRAFMVGLFVGLPLSAVFLVLALREANLEDTWSVVTGADAGLVFLATLVHAAVYIWQPLRWRAIARTPDVSTAQFAEMSVSGVAVNNVFPGRVGDVLRAHWLQVAGRISAGRALSTIFVDRSFDVVVLVAFAVVAVPFVTGAQWVTAIEIGGVVLFTCLLLTLTGARIYTRRRERARRQTRGLVRRVVRDTLEGLAEPLCPALIARLLALSVAVWTTWAVSASLVASALGLELSWIELVFVTAVVNLGLAIPSSPGFIGTYQWLAVSALTLVGVGPSQGLAFAIVMHAVWYFPTLVVGGTLLARRVVRSPHMAASFRRPLVEARDV